jgi:predicted MFS family arabinose efflux permease
MAEQTQLRPLAFGVHREHRLHLHRPHVDLWSKRAALALLCVAQFAAFFFVTLYLQEVRDYSPLTAGVAALPMSLGIVVGSTAATRLTGWFGPTPPLAAPGIVGRLACTGYTVQNCTSQAVQAAPLKRHRRC